MLLLKSFSSILKPKPRSSVEVGKPTRREPHLITPKPLEPPIEPAYGTALFVYTYRGIDKLGIGNAEIDSPYVVELQFFENGKPCSISETVYPLSHIGEFVRDRMISANVILGVPETIPDTYKLGLSDERPWRQSFYQSDMLQQELRRNVGVYEPVPPEVLADVQHRLSDLYTRKVK